MKDFLLNNKHLAILKHIGSNKNDIPYKVSKDTDTTYSHVFKLIKELKEDGILTTEKKGRVLLLDLTQKGREILLKAMKLKQVLG